MKFRILKTLRPELVVVVTALLAAFAGTLPARSDSSLAGVASVIDGDTIEIHGTRIRLHGVDAPESNQLCKRPGGERWRCGQRSALMLADRIGQATVRCEERDRDRYGRLVAVCFQAEKDLNRWLVSNGWAVAYRRYSTDYVRAEETARAANRGVWSGTFVMPWEWRRGERLTATLSDEAPGDCAIKGNISSSGERIYHVPGGRWYERTRIDKDQGERWFCSEEKARAAGWRRASQ